MKRGLILVSALIVTSLGTTPLLAEDKTVRLKSLDRFDGRTTLLTKAGPREMRVVIRNWIIDGGQKIPQFPERGFMIVQLRGGELITVINGKRQERQEDEFWTVPAGVTMGLETGDDSAVVQTMAVRSN